MTDVCVPGRCSNVTTRLCCMQKFIQVSINVFVFHHYLFISSDVYFEWHILATMREKSVSLFEPRCRFFILGIIVGERIPSLRKSLLIRCI